MKQKFFSVIALLICFLQLNAQTINYSVSKNDKNIYNDNDRSIKHRSLKIDFTSCYNAVLTHQFSYNTELVKGVSLGADTNVESESWKLDFIQNNENGDYIFHFQNSSYFQNVLSKEGYMTNETKLITPDPHIIIISKDKQRVYIYLKGKNDYRPFYAGHSNPEMIKKISAKKDKNSFSTYFTLVDAHFAKQTKLKDLSDLLVNNKLRIDSLSSNDVNDLFIYLKNNSQSRENGYGKALIEYSITCLKIKDLSMSIKLEIIDFLNQQIVEFIIKDRISVSRLVDNQNYVLKDGKNTIPIVSIDVDKCFSYYNANKNNVTENELNEFIVLFNKNNQIIKSSHVLFELLNRNSNEPNNNKLINFLAKMPDDIFKYVIDYNISQVEKLSETYLNSDSLSTKYPKMLMDHMQYQMALNFLDKAMINPQTKYLKFICITKLNGTIKGIDYLMGEKPRAAVANQILFDLGKKLKSDTVLLATKHLYNNYRKALDSIDITSISNYGYKIETYNMPTSDFKWITKVFKELKKTDEAYLVEYNYWVNKNLSFAEIELNVKKKELDPFIASSILYDYGVTCIEEAFRPGGAGVDRVRGKNECVKYLLKAAEYDPNDGSIYKLLGDAWAFIGDSNKKEYYYNKADSMGEDMENRQAPGKGRGPRKKDGSADMRYNSNK